jgi:hypothetical protein
MLKDTSTVTADSCASSNPSTVTMQTKVVFFFVVLCIGVGLSTHNITQPYETIFDLEEENYANLTSLTTVCKNALLHYNITEILALIREHTTEAQLEIAGLPLNEVLGISALNLFQISPAMMAVVAATRNKNFNTGGIEDIVQTNPPEHYVPQDKEFVFSRDFNKLMEAVTEPDQPYSPLFGTEDFTLLQGYVLEPSANDASSRAARAISVLLNHFVNNILVHDESKRFSVQFDDPSGTTDGIRATNVEQFINALHAAGWQFRTFIKQRISLFMLLVMRDEKTGAITDVPASIFVRTGYENATVPSGHAEFCWNLSNGTLNSTVCFFTGSGIRGTTFGWQWPAKDWAGENIFTNVADPEKSMDLMKYAAVYGSLANYVASKNKLFDFGYGVLGLCNDAVAVLQMIAQGHVDIYPLVMDKELILNLFDEWKEQVGESERVEKIRWALTQMPDDRQDNPSMRERALKSIPYAPGKELYKSTAEARRIIQALQSEN